MATSLNDVTAWIKDIFRRLRRLESGAFLENSSITSGRMRFIGGLLLIDSGGTLQVIGHFNGDGDFVWSGPWAFTGAGEITGNVDLTGNLEVLDDGRIKVGGILIEGGKITAGNVVIEPNRVTVGGGVSPATLQDGALSFATGGKVEAAVGFGGVKMSVGDAQVYVGSNGAAIQFGTRTFIVTAGGFNFINLDTIPQSLTRDSNPINSMYIDGTTGRPYRVVDG